MADLFFDEIIKVVKVDSQVVYDKVSRINAKSEENDFYLELDVHTELYPMLPSENYRMVISNSLLMDGLAVSGYFPEVWHIYEQQHEYLKEECFRISYEDITGDSLKNLMARDRGELKSLADKFEYVMHGLLYKMAEAAADGNDDAKVEVYISFGGLQLMLKGNHLKMHRLKVDQKLFLLLRKVS